MSHIQQAMVEFIDAKLKENGLAQHLMQTGDARNLMVEAAKVCVGIREKTNNNDGPMVELIQKTIGPAAHESWCMAFVQTCAAYAALKTGKKPTLFESEHCLTVWNNTPVTNRVKYVPLPGAIAIWRHGVTTNGHTGIITGSDGHIFQAVEGNTSGGSANPNGPIEREGGGVYYTSRSHLGAGDMHIVGFLKPF